MCIRDRYGAEWDDWFVDDANPIETKTWWGGAIRSLVHFGSLAAAIIPAASAAGVGAATTLPSEVFVIKVDEDHFKVAATKALAISNSPIGLTTVGSGSTHSFSAIKQNSKCVISLDNVIQSPLYPRMGGGTTLAATIPNREVLFTDAQGYQRFDLIKINE